MAQGTTAIFKGFTKIRRGHEDPVRWQRWQGVLAPVEPLLQSRGDGESTSEGLLQRTCRGQREIPAMAGTVPSATGLDPP